MFCLIINNYLGIVFRILISLIWNWSVVILYKCFATWLFVCFFWFPLITFQVQFNMHVSQLRGNTCSKGVIQKIFIYVIYNKFFSFNVGESKWHWWYGGRTRGVCKWLLLLLLLYHSNEKKFTRTYILQFYIDCLPLSNKNIKIWLKTI